MRAAPDQLKWVVDDVIPHTAALKALMGDVTILPGRDITPATISDADILLVRSITAVNESLLAGSSVQFVGTATAGVDHFDIDAIERLGVAWSAAPGSNAVSVVEYVLCALATAGWFERVMAGCPVGLVGLGQVGERLAHRLMHLGCEVMAYDPLRSDWPRISVVRSWRKSSASPSSHCTRISMIRVRTPPGGCWMLIGPSRWLPPYPSEKTAGIH